MWLEFALVGITLAFLIYRWSVRNHDFFKVRGIPYDKPVPIVGSMLDVLLRKKSFFDSVVGLYNKSNGKLYGIFDQNQPLLMIRDPELIKQITIKDFDHFVNHRTLFNSNEDYGSSGTNLFGNSLFSMHEAKWKDMRTMLSPVFTGSKMRQMFQLMNQVARDTSEALKREATMAPEGLELDVKDYCTRFMKLLKIEVFDTQEYFKNLVLDAIKYRKEHNIVRPDMINMLLEARDMNKSEHAKSHHRDWTDIEIVAQCFLFFFAGFETSAVLMCLTAHELMENPEVQARLYEEVKEVHRQLNGNELTYEALMGMKYMDMVISEVLRKWPAAIAMDRQCNKDIVYVVDGQSIEIKKGDVIWLPVCGIHRDPKFYDEPEKLDPERFNDANKDKIQPFTYFPFGIGPRICIASRFALLEAKAVIYYLIRDFQIEAAKKSSVPLKLSSNGFQIIPKDGFWLKFIARKS